MKINSSERNRVFFLFIVFSLWIVFICFSLVRIQVFNYSKNVSKVRAQSNRIFTMNPKRGTIYDSKGEVLAISVKAKSAFLSNKNSVHSLALFKSIRRRIRLPWRRIKDIEKRIRSGDRFIWIKRKLSEQEYGRLNKIKESNKSKSVLDFIEEFKRVYPQKAAACHILGGVGVDEQGLYGIEYTMDSSIRGKGGKARVLLDARRKVFNLEYLTEPVPGKDIYLTIDSSIQFFVEKELKKAVRKYKAKGGAVIVMDSRDGAILAMAGYPTYMPDRVQFTKYQLIKNRAISFLYHPGSTFKIVLASIALERDICSPRDEFNCYNGIYKIKDQKITDERPYKKLSFKGIIVYSSNIGAAKIAERVGKSRYYEGIKKFRFGRRIGIRLPAEEKGIFKPLNKWTGVSLQFLADGYEIAVTPLQMARAFNVIASGGYVMEPYLLKKVEGQFLKQDSKVKILTSGTAHRMSSIMTEVVNVGTGKKTRIAGIKIAGKTGTTKKIRENKNRKDYVSSFGGFYPAGSPRVTVFVLIDEPKGLCYGGDVAAPLFKSIAEKLLIYLKIFPDSKKRNEIRI